MCAGGQGEWSVRCHVLLSACLAAGVGPVLAEAPITQAELLRRVIDVQRLTTPPPAGERTVLFSSSVWPAPGGGEVRSQADSARFLRRDEDGWDVMAELSGPGAVTRIWSGNPQGEIRFVLDGEDVLTAPLADLFAGRVVPITEPLVQRGLTFYFPIGFARNCRILCRHSPAVYQINAVQFPPGTSVARFTLTLDDDAQAALAEVQRAFRDGLSDRQLLGDCRAMPVAVQEEIGPNDVLTQVLDKAGTVRALYIALTDKQNPHDLYALHRCLLRVYVDGETAPAVEVPLIDFFGSGFDPVPYNSLVLGTDRIFPVPLPERRAGEDRYMYCFFPMPYRNGLRIELVNLNENRKQIGFLLHVRVDTRPPAADALRFNAGFRREDPCRTPEYVLLQTSGRGRIIGCVLNVDSLRADWWERGAACVWIDGDKRPAYCGTACADDFGGAGGLHAFLGALLGVTRSGPYGKSSAYRWQLSDCVNFQKSVRFAIQDIPRDGPRDGTYCGSVVYWYGEPGAKRTFEPLAIADLTPPGLRIPGAVEIEGQVSGFDWGSVVKQKYAGGVELSGQQAVQVTTDQPVKINIPSEKAQTVRLLLRTNPRRAFQTVTVADTAGTLIGIATYNRAAEGLYTLGTVRLAPGDNFVTVHCLPPVMLDCWILEPQPDTP